MSSMCFRYKNSREQKIWPEKRAKQNWLHPVPFSVVYYGSTSLRAGHYVFLITISVCAFFVFGGSPQQPIVVECEFNFHSRCIAFYSFFAIFTSLSTDCLVCFSFFSHFILKLWTPYTCSFVIVNWIEGLLPFFFFPLIRCYFLVEGSHFFRYPISS